MNIHFATFITLLLLNFSLSASEKFQLRRDWEIGKVYIQETTTDMSIEIRALGDSHHQKTNVTQTMSVAVTKDGETDRKVAEVKIASIRGSMELMGQTMSYDSAEPAKSPPFLQQAFGALAGKSFSLVYDSANVFVETRASENLASTTPLGSGKSMSSQQFSDVFRKSQDLALPNAPVSVGDIWRYQDKFEMPPIGTILIEATGKFDSVTEQNGHRQAKLLIEGTFGFPAGESTMMSFAPGSKFTSEVLFDMDRKVVTSHDMNSTLNILIEGKKTPVTQSMKTRLISIESAK